MELQAKKVAPVTLSKARWMIHEFILARQRIERSAWVKYSDTPSQPLTGSGQYVFPSIRSTQRPMSENTINGALRGLGYGNDEMTGHGFRAMASTCLNEQGWHPDVIELQLAHAERNKVRAAYNRATRLSERRTMMQAWADYLDELRVGTKVLPVRNGVGQRSQRSGA